MNNTINVYELLGLIKDGKAPKKIIYNDNVYEFTDYDYRCIVTEIEKGFVEYWLIGNYNQDLRHLLNEKVEIIEEDKPIIEKISRLNYQQIGTYQLDNNDTLGFIKALNEQLTKHGRKLNEIIDYINKKEVDKR